MSSQENLTAAGTVGPITASFGVMPEMPDVFASRLVVDGASIVKFTNWAQFASMPSITLSWTAVTGATGYILQVSENSSFRGVTVQSWNQTAVTKTLTVGALPAGHDVCFGAGKTYYWRVFAYVYGAMSTSSAVWSFQLGWQKPDLTDAIPPIGYDVIQWNDPNVGPLIQANMFQSTEVMQFKEQEPPVPVAGSPFFGTPVEINFTFQDYNGWQFTGWAGGVGAERTYVNYKLYRGDRPGVLFETTDFVFNRYLGLSGDNLMYNWDATNKTYKETLFMESNAHVSVGDKYLLEVEIKFNTNFTDGLETVKFYKLLTVASREVITNPYGMEIPKKRSVLVNGRICDIRGALAVSGPYDLVEGNQDVEFFYTGLAWSPINGSVATLLSGMFLEPTSGGTNTYDGYITASIVGLVSGTKLPKFQIAFEWRASSSELSSADLSVIDSAATVPQFYAFQRICQVKTIGNLMVGFQAMSGDWVVAQAEDKTPATTGTIFGSSEYPAGGSKMFFGGDGLPILGAPAVNFAEKQWLKLTPRFFETVPANDPYAEVPTLSDGDKKSLILKKVGTTVSTEWGTATQKAENPTTNVVDLGVKTAGTWTVGGTNGVKMRQIIFVEIVVLTGALRFYYRDWTYDKYGLLYSVSDVAYQDVI